MVNLTTHITRKLCKNPFRPTVHGVRITIGKFSGAGECFPHAAPVITDNQRMATSIFLMPIGAMRGMQFQSTENRQSLPFERTAKALEAILRLHHANSASTHYGQLYCPPSPWFVFPGMVPHFR